MYVEVYIYTEGLAHNGNVDFGGQEHTRTEQLTVGKGNKHR